MTEGTIIRTPVRSVRVDMICPKCSRGRMRPNALPDADGQVRKASYSSRHYHSCNECRYVAGYVNVFPYIEHTEIK